MFDDPELIAEFVLESNEHLRNVEDSLLQMERAGANADIEVVHQVFRAVHSIKGAAGFLGFGKLQTLSHSVESVLNPIREKALEPTTPIVELLLQAIDTVGCMLNDIERSNEMDIAELVEQLNATKAGDAAAAPHPNNRDIAEPTDYAGPPPTTLERASAESASTAKGSAARHHQATETSVRVQVELLDRLMNLAGELVLGRNQLVQSVDSGDVDNLRMLTGRVDQVTSDLQDAIMQTRMQPIGSVFGKLTRLVRDTCNQLGKSCDLRLKGQDVEIDRTIGEALADPLTHLVRNSLDHGIESPSQRVAAGKAPSGNLELHAFHESGKVRIEIRDDGAGMDADLIRTKAVNKGLLSKEETALLSDAEAINLIFHPGFSTAATITELSGRGVGMDVVRSNIESLGGSVDVATTLGQGATMTLTLPSTLAIIPSMIVGDGQERYAIPQVNTAELVRVREAEAKERIAKIDDAELLRLRGALLPIIRLGDVLAEHGPEHPLESPAATTYPLHIVVVENGPHRYGLVVDALFDSEEIVVKPLGRHLAGCRCLSGATILGDGRVALILDIAGIANRVGLQDRHHEIASTNETSGETKVSETQSVLLFENHGDERFAVPMHFVSRIERIRSADLFTVGRETLLRNRRGTVPLLRLEDHIQARRCGETTQEYVIIYEVMGHEIGLLASSLVDIRDVSVEFDEMVSAEPGVVGTQMLDGAPTRALDLHGLTRLAQPDWFPADPDRPNSPVSDRPADDQSSGTLLLLAEDSAFFRRQLSALLSDAGYEVVACEDGRAALKTLQSAAFEFAALLTDIEMPNMTGLELTRHVRADDSLRNLPIIALTSLAGQDDEERGYQVGIDDYQVKLDRDNLLASVQRLIAKQAGVSA